MEQLIKYSAMPQNCAENVEMGQPSLTMQSLMPMTTSEHWEIQDNKETQSLSQDLCVCVFKIIKTLLIYFIITKQA